MTPSASHDIYRFDIGLPPDIAVLRVAAAETNTILIELVDDRFTVGARVHALRKYTKRMRSLFRLVRSGFPDFKAANVSLRDTARLVSSHRDARVLADQVEHLGRTRNVDPVVDWFDYRAEAAERLASLKLLLVAERMQDLLVQLDRWDFSGIKLDDVMDGFRKTFGIVLDRSALVSDQSDSHEAHEWRKSCKDHWYHLRLLHDALPKSERGKVEDYDLLCDLLGNVHDRDVLLHHLDTLPEFLGETRQATSIARAARRERKAMQTEAVALAGTLLDDEAKNLASKVRRNWKRRLHPRR
jgi:CHAD domain-containing protein